MIGGATSGIDGLARPLTKYSLLKRRAGTTRAAFVGHWRTVHVDVLVNKARHKAYNKRYVQNEFLDLAGLDDQRFDGAAQMHGPFPAPAAKSLRIAIVHAITRIE